MSFKLKIFVIVLIVGMVGGILYVGEHNNINEEESKKQSFYQTETVRLWYTDESFTDFFTNAAVEFHEKNPDIRVIPTLVSSAEYLENINAVSLSAEEFPDLYVLSNDSLEKAYLAGLASKVKDSEKVLNPNHFGEGALYSVMYHNNYVAYPMTFDTTVLLYNKTYLQSAADKINEEGLKSYETGDTFDEDGNIIIEENNESVENPVIMSDFIPESFDDIISFSGVYEADEGVDAILEWDVSDIFFNYLFVGNYMVVGGDAGDTTENIDIYNENSLACVRAYKNLNDVFAFDASSSNYESVLDDFLNNKTVFTMATADAIAKIDEKLFEQAEAVRIAAEADALDHPENAESIDIPKTYEYGYALIPNVTADLYSRSLSVTNALVINGYSERKAAANKFAAFVTTDYADEIYTRTGKLAASIDAGYTEEAFQVFQEEYAGSIPLPKLVEASNLWVQLEIALSDIWNGEDADSRLKTFGEQMSSQLVQ